MEAPQHCPYLVHPADFARVQDRIDNTGMGTGGVRLTWGQLCGSPFPSSRRMNTGNWSTWTRSARHANQTNSQGHPLRPADARGRSRQACLHKRIRL
jgi:hypothetical protein